jgi:hypothetical protein
MHSARRELAKWLNEAQTKPIDRQALAVVLGHLPEVVAHQEAGELPDKPPRHWVHLDGSYDQRAKAIIAFNTCTGDLDDKLDAAWRAALTAKDQK